MSESKLPTDFGIFYPTGWIVAAFPKKEFAEQVQRDLLTGGYDEADCKVVGCDQVIPAAQDQLEEAGWLARLGKSDEMLREHLRAAKAGSAYARSRLFGRRGGSRDERHQARAVRLRASLPWLCNTGDEIGAGISIGQNGRPTGRGPEYVFSPAPAGL
jgi:hypothetical protein